MRQYKRLRPGYPISAAGYDQAMRGLERLQNVAGTSGLRAGNVPMVTPAGVQITSAVYQPFYARIIGQGAPFLTYLEEGLTPVSKTCLARSVDEWFLTWPYYVLIDDEIIKVTKHVAPKTEAVYGVKPTFNWEIERGQAGTQAAEHGAATEVYSVWIPYEWVEVYAPSFGLWLDYDGGRHSDRIDDDTISIPCWDTKGIQRVPTDGSAIVQLWAGYDFPTPTYYIFEYWPDSGSGESAAISLSGSTGTNPFATRPSVADASLPTVQDDLHCTYLTKRVGKDDGVIQVAGVGMFPQTQPYNVLVNDREVVRVTASVAVEVPLEKLTDPPGIQAEINPENETACTAYDLTVVRGVAGTTAQAHIAFAQVALIGGLVTSLVTGLDAEGTVAEVNDAEGFPTDGRFLVQIGSEYLAVVNGASGGGAGGNGKTWRFQRAVEGSTAAEHGVGSVVSLIVPDVARVRRVIHSGYSIVHQGAVPGEAIVVEPTQLIQEIPNAQPDADDWLPGYLRRWNPTLKEMQNDELIWHKDDESVLMRQVGWHQGRKAFMPACCGAKDASYFRQVGNTPLSLNYPAAMVTGLSGSTLDAGRRLMAGLPFVCPRSITLDRLSIWMDEAGPSGAAVRMAIYEATSATNLWPNKLIVDTGELSASSVGYLTKIFYGSASSSSSSGDSVTLEANRIYWGFVLCNDAFQPAYTKPLDFSVTSDDGTGSLDPAVRYIYRVAAVLNTDETQPTAAGATYTSGAAYLSWTAWDVSYAGAFGAVEVIGYRVYRTTNNDDWTNSLIATLGPTATNYTDTGGSGGEGAPIEATTGELGSVTDSYLLNMLGASDTDWQQFYGIKYPFSYAAFPDPFPEASADYLASGGFWLPVFHISETGSGGQSMPPIGSGGQQT